MFFHECNFFFSQTNSLIAKPIPDVVENTIISVAKNCSDKKIINKIEENIILKSLLFLKKLKFLNFLLK